jgi:uncharacterized SAM-binding protein YcdF (DUF218 family)
VTRPTVLRAILQVGLAALVGSVALIAYMAVQISERGKLDERRSVDAIVVLGAAQFNGRPSDVFEARLEHAVALWDQGLAEWFVVTGGKLPNDDTTEAEVARGWAISHGVPRDRILWEDRGRTTLESLEGVRRIFRSEALRAGLFVSDETHMLRVLRMAEDLGMEAFGSPTRTSPSDLDESRRRRAIVHEIAGLAAYYVGGGKAFGDAATVGSP